MLVDLPEGNSPGCAVYDLDKKPDTKGFQPLRSGHVLVTMKTVVRSAMNSTKLNAPNDADIFLEYYEKAQDKKHTTGTFANPNQNQTSSTRPMSRRRRRK